MISRLVPLDLRWKTPRSERTVAYVWGIALNF